jgi:hypothetical protein
MTGIRGLLVGLIPALAMWIALWVGVSLLVRHMN